MTVDLILHGVPNGHDMWGVSDDTHYFSTFYVQKDEKESLSVETRKVSGKSYCYYNYIKYNGVTASDERAGSYIGVTLRFDAYYKDILNVYHLCEIVYNNLLDTILIKNGDNVKFKIAKFGEAENELVEIRKKIFNLINLSATAKDFTSINDSFFSNDSKTVKAFLLDCTPDNVMQAIVKYGKVEISKYYPSVNETKKLKGVEDRYIATIAQKDKDLQNANLQIEDLRLERNRLQNELEDKKSEIKELNRLVSEKEEAIKNNENALSEVDSYIQKCDESQIELDNARCENEKLRSHISNMENTIKRNEQAVRESETMKRQIQELQSYLQKQNKEIERIKTELIESQGKSLPPVRESNKRHPHKKNHHNKGRQSSSFTEEHIDYDMANHYDYNPGTTSVRDKISRFGSFPLWQKITALVIVLALFCLSVICIVKLCSSNDDKPEVEQATKTSYIDIEDSSIDADTEVEDCEIEDYEDEEAEDAIHSTINDDEYE